MPVIKPFKTNSKSISYGKFRSIEKRQDSFLSKRSDLFQKIKDKFMREKPFLSRGHCQISRWKPGFHLDHLTPVLTYT
mgnify:CR=1 FL=1